MQQENTLASGENRKMCGALVGALLMAAASSFAGTVSVFSAKAACEDSQKQ